MNTIERGAELFAYDSRGWTLKPQQYEVGEALDRLAGTTAILMQRRTAKTESVLLWVTAMMEQNPGLRVAFTMATTREAARAKFMADVYPVLEKLTDYRDDVHLLRGAGYESFTLNGSNFTVLAPSDKAFRSKAFDIIICDEAGEADPEDTDALLAALLPTLGTSAFGMLVLMGTAGDYREGSLFWDALHDDEASVVDYSADDIDMDRLKDWDYVAEQLQRYHVGVGSLTTLERLRRDWKLLSPERFAREYLGVWGTKGTHAGIFDSAQWAALALLGDLPTPPRRFALAVAATEASSSIVAAWREDGEGRLLLLEHFEGRARLPIVARDLSRKYRAPIVLDSHASQVMQDVKQSLEQLRPAPRVKDQTYEDVGAAHERIVLDVANGTVRHFAQPKMSVAFEAVRRVQMGAKWKFGRPSEDHDITPAQAATLALRYFDSMPRAVTGAGASLSVAV